LKPSGEDILVDDNGTTVNTLITRLGDDWKNVMTNPNLLDSTRAYARVIERHFDLSDVLVMLENELLSAYLVRAKEQGVKGYWLFSDSLQWCHLVGWSLETVISNITSGPTPRVEGGRINARIDARQVSVSSEPDKSLEAQNLRSEAEFKDPDRTFQGRREVLSAPSETDEVPRVSASSRNIALQNSSHAYDKRLLSKIDGPNIPSRTAVSSLSSSAQDSAPKSPNSLLHNLNRQLNPLSVPDRLHPSLNSPVPDTAFPNLGAGSLLGRHDTDSNICWKCGSPDHFARDCGAQALRCYACGKLGK
jgi:hypothetical protein